MNTRTIIFMMTMGLTLAGLGIIPALDVPEAFAQNAGPCTNPNPNAACSYAPGHGGVPPGQTGDPSGNAPGHLK
jgi:hypothetical protein